MLVITSPLTGCDWPIYRRYGRTKNDNSAWLIHLLTRVVLTVGGSV